MYLVVVADLIGLEEVTGGSVACCEPENTMPGVSHEDFAGLGTLEMSRMKSSCSPAKKSLDTKPASTASLRLSSYVSHSRIRAKY